MAETFPAFNSWQQRLAQQSAVGGLNPAQAKAAAAGGSYGEVEARYEADQKNRQLDLQQQQITNQAEQFGANLALKSEEMAGKPMQTAISATGALGSLALGATAMNKAGLFDATVPSSLYTPTTTTVYGPGNPIPANPAVPKTPGEMYAPSNIETTAYDVPAVAGAGEIANIAYNSEGIAEGSKIAMNSAGYLYNTSTAANITADASLAGETTSGVWSTIGTYLGYVGDAAVAAWVLCSELVRQGGLDPQIVDEEWEYIKHTITYEEYLGYRVIADPLVKLMQRSKTFTWVIAPFIRAFAYEMASRVNKDIKGRRFGSVILFFGLPLCRLFAPRMKRMEV